MKRALSILTIAYMLAACILPFMFIDNKGIDDSAVRFEGELDVVYLDSEAIALSNGSDADSGLRAEALEAFGMINDIRDEAGLETLDWNQNLESVSDVRAAECDEDFSHTRPNGSPWNTVNSQIQGGENLAFGQDDPQEVVDDWMDSPTHRDNILYGDFSSGSISIYQNDDGVKFWANEFSYD